MHLSYNLFENNYGVGFNYITSKEVYVARLILKHSRTPRDLGVFHFLFRFVPGWVM